MAREIDIVIVGAGPAGLSAAETIATQGFACICIDRMGPGGALMNLGVLHELPEASRAITGPDLVGELVERATTAGAEIVVADVLRIAPDDGGVAPRLTVETGDATYRATSVVVATGLEKATMGLAEEAAFEGRGLCHCAHCDGPLYRGLPIAVAGSCRWTATEAAHLAGIAGRVTIVTNASLAAVPSERIMALEALPNVRILPAHVTALVGEDGLERVAIVHEGRVGEIEARALFIYCDRRPADTLLGSLGNTEACAAAGVFVAGDVRHGARECIAEAIADGARAGHNAVRWARAGRSILRSGHS